MAKDPAFLFYPNDYLGGTMGMSFDLKGAYVELFLLQFNIGNFTSDQAIAVVGVDRWEAIRYKFKSSEKLFYNERLRAEIEKRKSFSESRRKNVQNRYIKPTLEDTSQSTKEPTYELRMEDEDRNRIVKLNSRLKFKYISNEFLETWVVLIKQPKWKNKSDQALQMALKKLSNASEQDAIKMMENTIAGNWQGIFELDNKQSNGKQQHVTGKKQSPLRDAAEAVLAEAERLKGDSNNSNGQTS